MTPSRFCATLVWAALAAAAAIAAFNFALDPYLLFNLPRQAGFNAIKPAAETRELLMKAYTAPRSAARTLILGSSRCDSGLNPDHPAWAGADRPVYNLGLWGAHTYEMLRHLQHVVALTGPGEVPRKLVVCIDFEDFLLRPPAPVLQAAAREAGEPVPDGFEERLAVLADGRPNPARALRMLEDYASALLSLDALTDSIKTLSANRWYRNTMDIGTNGLMAETRYRQNIERKGVAELFVQQITHAVRVYGEPRRSLSETPGGPIKKLAIVQQLLAIAKSHGMEVVIVIPPAHASRLEILDALGYWPDYERWKQVLAELAAAGRADGMAVKVWDFGGFEAYSLERLPPSNDRQSRLTWFWDPIHFTSALGDLMLDRILGQPGAVPYGVELTPENVAQRIAGIRIDRETYRLRQPEEAQRRAGVIPRHLLRQPGARAVEAMATPGDASEPL